MSSNQLSLFDQEIWRWVKGYEGRYKVSNFGRVMSVRLGKNKILKLCPNIHGYLICSLFLNGAQKTRDVHNLVAYAFLPPCPGKQGRGSADWQIDHIDENKTNNHVSNLRWLTAKENKLRSKTFKLKEKDVIAIRADKRSLRKIAADYNVCPALIHSVKSRKIWRDV